jgi:hypothetical protein
MQASSSSEQHVETGETKKPGLIRTIADKVEAFVEVVAGVSPKHPSTATEQHGDVTATTTTTEHYTERVPTAQKLDERQEAVLKESELYSWCLKENEEDLAKSADKLDESQRMLRNELDQIRFAFKENEGGLRMAIEQFERNGAMLRDKSKLVDDILNDNEQVILGVADSLEACSKKLKAESNRLKAEELCRAADELKLKAERLQKIAVETQETEVTTTTTTTSKGDVGLGIQGGQELRAEQRHVAGGGVPEHYETSTTKQHSTGDVSSSSAPTTKRERDYAKR